MTSSFVLFWFPDIVTEPNLDGILNKKKKRTGNQKRYHFKFEANCRFSGILSLLCCYSGDAEMHIHLSNTDIQYKILKMLIFQLVPKEAESK